jgi:hypothetical protein
VHRIILNTVIVSNAYIVATNDTCGRSCTSLHRAIRVALNTVGQMVRLVCVFSRERWVMVGSVIRDGAAPTVAHVATSEDSTS